MSAAYNRVTLLGNLTRDPQIKALASGAVAEFGLAVGRRFRTAAGEEREDVCFVDCSAFGKQAGVIGQYCRKGKQVLIEGRLKYDVWDDKSGHGKRSKLSVVVESFQLLGNANSDNQSPERAVVEGPTKRNAEPREQDVLVANGAFEDADIPF